MDMQRPRVKRVLDPWRLAGGRIRIGTAQYGVASEIEDDQAGSVWTLLSLLDGTRGVERVVDDLCRGRPHLSGDDARAMLDELIEAGFVEDAGAAPPPELGAPELQRYDRNLNYFAWVDTQARVSPWEQQRRLKQARVTLLGLGGSGSAMALSLVGAGVGALHCVDADLVEPSNLNRQFLYTQRDLGRSKVEAAVERLRDLNPHVDVTGQELRVGSSADLLPLMQGRDLFLLCADAPPQQIERWTNEAALRTRTPWLLSAYAGPMLVVGLFVPLRTPCHACLTHAEERKRRETWGEVEPLLTSAPLNAVIAPTANLTGHLGALEAVYFLAGMAPQTLGRVFHQNLMVYDHCYYVEAPFWPECPACGTPRAGA